MGLPFVVVQARHKGEKCSCCFNEIKAGHHFIIFHTQDHVDIQICFVCIKNMKKTVSDQIPIRSPLKETDISSHLY